MRRNITITRRKAICGAGTICKFEIDGKLLCQIKNGHKATLELDEGNYHFRFLDSFDKTLKEGVLSINQEDSVDIEIQFNGATGKLDVFSHNIKCNSEQKPLNVTGKLIMVFAFIVVSSILIYCSINNLFTSPTSSNSGNTEGTSQTQIYYTKVSIKDMLTELDANALRAEEKYQDQYLEITGKITNFDSDGKYITIAPIDSPNWTWSTIHCSLTDSSQKTFLLEKNVGDVITIRCKVTSIGEVLGYSVRIIEIFD